MKRGWSGMHSALCADRRGAMMVIGIPMACLMVGMLYYVVGIGHQLVAREQLQDAADAAAFSGAIMQARGMNMLALVNQVMAGLVAVLVVTRMLQVVTATAIAVAAAIAFASSGDSLTVVPAATDSMAQAAQAFEQLKTNTTPILQGLHVFELGVKYALPAAAEAKVSLDVQRGLQATPRFGFLLPAEHPLPVEKGEFRELCDRSGSYASDLMRFPTGEILGQSEVGAVLGPGLDSLGHSFSELFCQPGGLEFPGTLPGIPLARPILRNLPELEITKECTAASPEGFITGASQRAASLQNQQNACEQSAQELARAAPGPDGGPNTHCEYRFTRGGPGGLPDPPQSCEPCRGGRGEGCAEFMAKVDAAGHACRPDTHHLADYNYQRRGFTWHGELSEVAGSQDGQGGTRYLLQLQPSLEYQDEGVLKAPKPPCGQNGTIAETYNERATYHASGEYGQDDFLCEQEHFHPDPESVASAAGTQGLSVEEWKRFGFGEQHWQLERGKQGLAFVGRWQAATFMHSCDERIRSQAELVRAERKSPEHWPAAATTHSGCGGGEIVQQRMRRESAPPLGGESFQRRAVVFGDTTDAKARELVGRLPFGLPGEHSGDAPPSEAAREHAFVAQAEYYYDTDYDQSERRPQEDPAEWLWSMNWRARLRRVRMPEDVLSPERPSSKTHEAVAECGFESPSRDAQEACSDASPRCGQAQRDALRGLPALAEELLVH